MMHRTQIYLPQPLQKRLKAQAKRQGVTLAEVIRRAIDQPEQRTARLAGRHLLVDLHALTERPTWKKLPRNLASRIDETVYGSTQRR